MSGFDLTILFLYLAFVLSLGVYFARRHKSTEDYFLAGRNVPGWVMGFSMMGTIVSSATFIGGPGAVFNADMWTVPYYITLPIIIYFLSRWLVPFYRHRVRMSAYEYLGQRFAYPAQAYGSGVFVFQPHPGHECHLLLPGGRHRLPDRLGYLVGRPDPRSLHRGLHLDQRHHRRGLDRRATRYPAGGRRFVVPGSGSFRLTGWALGGGLDGLGGRQVWLGQL